MNMNSRRNKLLIGGIATIISAGIAVHAFKKEAPQPTHRVSYTAFTDNEKVMYGNDAVFYHTPYTVQIVETWNPGAECCNAEADKMEITMFRGGIGGGVTSPLKADFEQIFASYDRSRKPGQTALRIGKSLASDESPHLCGTGTHPCDPEKYKAAQQLIDTVRGWRTGHDGFVFDDRYVTPMFGGYIRPILPGERIDGKEGYSRIGRGAYSQEAQ